MKIMRLLKRKTETSNEKGEKSGERNENNEMLEEKAKDTEQEKTTSMEEMKIMA